MRLIGCWRFAPALWPVIADVHHKALDLTHQGGLMPTIYSRLYNTLRHGWIIS